MRIAWRPLLRDFVSYLLVVAVVVGLALVVWWTRHPESPLLTAARDWPLVGSLAASFQDRYLEAEQARQAALTVAESTVEFIYEPKAPRPYVWVAEGTPLRAEPSPEAPALVELDAMTNLFVEESREDWVRVRHRGSDYWVRRPERPAPLEPDSTPDPVLPLKSRAPGARVLAAADRSMSGSSSEFTLGPYRGRANVPVEKILEVCEEPIAGVEARYLEIVGLEPVGEAAEVLLLFDTKSSYDSFSGRESVHATGHAGAGYAASYVGDRTAEAVCGTLVHEVAHLLNRRAIGPALPPWLGEGVAEYMETTIAGLRPPVQQVELARAGGTLPGLSELVSWDEEDFHSRFGEALAYGVSGLWIEHLLEHAELGGKFREFLGYLAAGGPWAKAPPREVPQSVRETPPLGDDLVFFLGRDFERLDAGFRAWVWSRS